ncbi:RNB domain-containing ribonuclease [Neisseriaceae bacterium ESL0693]|nr:RNB domain-containing ribonuclease [Neisseriaceae bacterium ESL0693]
MKKHIFYEESGQFKVAEIVQQNDTTYLVNTQHGKRAKIKTNHVFLTFEGDAEAFLSRAQAESADIDIDLLWEAVGQLPEFSAHMAAQEYFGTEASTIAEAAILIALYAAPVYFYKKGKAVFKAAPEDTLKQALAALERKKEQEATIQQWVEALMNGQLPAEIAAEVKTILHMPDKQTLAYKAVSKAATQQKTSIFHLLDSVGAVPSLADYFMDGFLLNQFPKGTAWPAHPEPQLPVLERADRAVQAFSIDDLETNEIDDAISLLTLPNGHRQIGVHIAVPSLAIEAGSVMEQGIFARQSTVYYPGGKITMLPPDWINAFSLDAGDYRPAMSLYAEVDDQWQIVNIHSNIEYVYIDANLRIQEIAADFQPQQPRQPEEAFAHQHAMNWLYDFALARQQARGKYDPARPPQYDYGIEFDEHKQVRISVRERGSPIDTLVSEIMILANTSWARMLSEAELPGLFRVQPTGKVRMSTQSEPHVGLGLQHYAWFTSPLRRAVDYINQKQLISLLQPDTPSRFEPKDNMLFAALRDFESTYGAYNEFQRHMEAYWSLIYIQQQELREVNALLVRDDLVRIEGMPLTGRVTGLPIDVLPKSRLRLNITGTDLVQVSVGLSYLNVLMPE